jgi:hypothetical protein
MGWFAGIGVGHIISMSKTPRLIGLVSEMSLLVTLSIVPKVGGLRRKITVQIVVCR